MHLYTYVYLFIKNMYMYTHKHTYDSQPQLHKVLFGGCEWSPVFSIFKIQVIELEETLL